MAVLRPPPPYLLLILFLIPQSPALSRHNCPPENFTNQKQYSNCTDLRFLHSKLHWSFTPQNSTLSIAFIAPPEKPNGWIAWAINPTRKGMLGSQALVAFKDDSKLGSIMTVKTYNITNYMSLKEGKIAFEVPESRAEFSGGVMKIFATVKLPENMMVMNMVWQVGGVVSNGRPVMHKLGVVNRTYEVFTMVVILVTLYVM